MNNLKGDNENIIDDLIFQQLLDMDDDDTHDFTKSILSDFFAQVDESMPKFIDLLKNNQLVDVARLGHFLKGSSAGVGASNIRNICEKIQHYELYAEKNQEKIFLESQLNYLLPAIDIAKKQLWEKVNSL